MDDRSRIKTQKNTVHERLCVAVTYIFSLCPKTNNVGCVNSGGGEKAGEDYCCTPASFHRQSQNLKVGQRMIKIDPHITLDKYVVSIVTGNNCDIPRTFLYCIADCTESCSVLHLNMLNFLYIFSCIFSLIYIVTIS